MTKVNIYNQEAQVVGKMELKPKIFGVKINSGLIHQAVVAQMANNRQVLAHTKDRGEVRGSGRKPWAQKGTGRARHGSSRSPIWIGGGITFGPRKDRNFDKKINKKMKQKAMMMVLSDKVKNKRFVVIDKFEINQRKTKVVNFMLDNFEKVIFYPEQEVLPKEKEKMRKGPSKRKEKKISRSLLIITDKKNDNLKISARNLVGVHFINLDNINLVDLLKYKNIIISQEAIKKLEERYNI